MSKKWMVRMVGIGVLSGAVAVSAACGGGSTESVPGGSVSHGMDPNMDMGDSPSGQQPDIVWSSPCATCVTTLARSKCPLARPCGSICATWMAPSTTCRSMVSASRRWAMPRCPAATRARPPAWLPCTPSPMAARASCSAPTRKASSASIAFYCTLPGHKDAGMLGELKVI